MFNQYWRRRHDTLNSGSARHLGLTVTAAYLLRSREITHAKMPSWEYHLEFLPWKGRGYGNLSGKHLIFWGSRRITLAVQQKPEHGLSREAGRHRKQRGLFITTLSADSFALRLSPTTIWWRLAQSSKRRTEGYFEAKGRIMLFKKEMLYCFALLYRNMSYPHSFDRFILRQKLRGLLLKQKILRNKVKPGLESSKRKRSLPKTTQPTLTK